MIMNPPSHTAIRVGQGYDVHRMRSVVTLGTETPVKPLVLGGIIISNEYTLEAHSDGDVVLHALMDALLSAAGLGDIGEFFPPSDPAYANAHSADLLKGVRKAVDKALPDWQLENVVVTVFLETPKLKAFKADIQQNLCQLLEVAHTQVAIHAKTAEKLGALGRGEGVGAAVSLLVSVPAC